MVFYIGYQNNFWLGSRFNIFLVPLASMGLAELLSRLSRRWLIPALAVLTLVLFLGPLLRYMGEFCMFQRQYHSLEWMAINRSDRLSIFWLPVGNYRWFLTYAANIIYILIGVKMVLAFLHLECVPTGT